MIRPLGFCSEQRRFRIPVLPFCQLTLRATKPRPSAYPASLSTIGDHIRTKRVDLGLRQCDVAEVVGVTTSTVTNWESNRTSPDLRAVPKVIEFLSYEPETLVPMGRGEALIEPGGDGSRARGRPLDPRALGGRDGSASGCDPRSGQVGRGLARWLRATAGPRRAWRHEDSGEKDGCR